MIKRISGTFIEWCAEVTTSDKYIILDTETTGLQGQVIELAIIDAQGNIIYDGLFKSTCAIEPGAQEQHHISEAMLSGSPYFYEEWPEIYRRIQGKSIITYGAPFDRGRILATILDHHMLGNLEESDIELMQKLEFYCLMEEYRRYGRFPRWQKLKLACSQQNIKFVQEHRALSDALATLQVIRAMARKAEVKA